MSETENLVVQKTKTTKTRRVKKTASADKTKTTRKRRVKKTKQVVAPVAVVEETLAPATTTVETTVVAPTVTQTATPAVTQTATPTVTATTATTTPEVVQESNEHVDTVTSAFTQITSLSSTAFSTIHSAGFGQKELRLVSKAYRTCLKALQKVQDETLVQSLKRGEELQKLLNKRIRKNKGKSNPNSGIQKKHPAHPLLASFLSVDEGSPVSRVEALKAITNYVKEHQLQVPDNKKTFHLKGDLHTLFPNSETMGYTDIMREIKTFFPPAQTTK